MPEPWEELQHPIPLGLPIAIFRDKMIKIPDGNPRKMRSYEIIQCGVLFCHPLYGTRAVPRLLRGPHTILLILSTCVGRGWSHSVLLCVLVKGTGCVRGLSGLEGAWDREEDIPGHDNLTGKGKWQTQNTIAISQNQFNSRESKQGSHTSLVTGRGRSMSRQGGQDRSKGSMRTRQPSLCSYGAARSLPIPTEYHEKKDRKWFLGERGLRWQRSRTTLS